MCSRWMKGAMQSAGNLPNPISAPRTSLTERIHESCRIVCCFVPFFSLFSFPSLAVKSEGELKALYEMLVLTFSAFAKGEEIMDEGTNVVIIIVFVISVHGKCTESTKTILFSTGFQQGKKL